ncbi:MAG: serine/threonine protein kinase [Candidatus Riflebacteria bacterium]|nr:serine/threonine protein kinase [Candidatus Riflebacteria bacterium]
MENPFPPECARRFQPEKLLATGGFGSVWLGTQTDLGRHVAVKLLHPSALGGKDDVDRFLNEARVTASLAHPNIVIVIDAGAEGGIPWIAYEYLPGRTLREILKPGPMPLAEGLHATVQVAAALEAAHSKGILHRDIKPANVLEAEPGHFKVTDFGIAKPRHSESSLRDSGDAMGTAGYISPEQILGEPASTQSDLYSLAVLLFEALTGAPPYQASSPAAILVSHVQSPVPRASSFRPGVPPGVDQILFKGLAKDPKDRYAFASSFRQAVEQEIAKLGGEQAKGPVKGPQHLRKRAPLATEVLDLDAPQPPRQPRRPRLWPLIALALVALVVVAVPVVWRLWNVRRGGGHAVGPGPTVRVSLPPAPTRVPLDLILLEGRLALTQTRMERRSDLYTEICARVPHLDMQGSGDRAAGFQRDEEADLSVVTDISGHVPDAVPAIADTPARELWLAIRALTLRIVATERIERCRHLIDMANFTRRKQLDPVMHLDEICLYGEKLVDVRDVHPLLKRFLLLFQEALKRASSDQTFSAIDLGELLGNLHRVSRAFVYAQWSPAAKQEIHRTVATFEQALRAPGAPFGPALGDLAAAVWDCGWRGLAGRRRPEAVAQLRLAVAALPRTDAHTRASLERLVTRIETEGAGQRTASPAVPPTAGASRSPR